MIHLVDNYTDEHVIVALLKCAFTAYLKLKIKTASVNCATLPSHFFIVDQITTWLLNIDKDCID